MRMLFTTWPAYGHLLPMLPLIRAAARAGHDVVVSTGSNLIPLVERLGLPAHRSGTTQAEDYAEVATKSVQLGTLPEMEQQLAAADLLFGASAVRRARDLAPLIADWRPDLVVHEVTELGGPAAAEAAGVRQVTHGYGPTPPVAEEFAGVIGRTLSAAGLPDPIPTVLSGTYLDICPPSMQLADLPWRQPVQLRPSAGEAAPGESLPEGFATLPDRPLVYLTLGTITNENPTVLAAAIEACRRLDLNVLVTTGPGSFAVLPQERGILHVPYVSQALVLPHAAAVISHGGAGTMLGALCHGIPQLTLPQGADQPMNAAALVRAGAGRVLEAEQVDADSVAAEMKRLLGDPAVRAAARRTATEIAAMPSAADVLPALIG